MHDDGGEGPCVLLVEDELPLARLVSRGLQRAGYDVLHAADGRGALDLCADPAVAVVVLDINIPRPDGLTVLRHLRDAGDQRPILLLTGRTAVSDRVRGLQAGADDYLPKPFALDELTARIEALLRRHRRREQAVVVSGSLTLDPAARCVSRQGREIDLTPREFDLLATFVHHPRQVLSREQLLDRVWGERADDSNIVAVYVKYLRDKVDRPFGARSLVTVRGAGYRWDPDA